MAVQKNFKTVVQIELPQKLVAVFAGEARYRGAYGGRGSGKTRSFAKMAAVKGYQLSCAGEEGLIVIGREYMNSLEESSFAEVKSAILSQNWLRDHYEVGDKYIKTKDGRISFAFVGLKHHLDNIKSKARIHLLWVDEAEKLSESAWSKVIPSVREKKSEIWITWNPERKISATHKRFRESPPHDAKIVALNWRDNPWFPDVLEKERLEDKRKRPEQYGHIWEGDFIGAMEGAYFAHHLMIAREEKRIANVARDPLMSVKAFWDIGGTGARADATAIWVAQFIGREIRVLNYYEAQGQPLAAHIDWLRRNNYADAHMVLPHDGATKDRVHDVSFASSLRDAGFFVDIVANQGAGAARLRIEAARRLFNAIWFNQKTTKAGIDALGWYHERRDENRQIGLGPEHDWSSHGADAFGLMCVAYESPVQNKSTQRYQKNNVSSTSSWMAG